MSFTGQPFFELKCFLTPYLYNSRGIEKVVFFPTMEVIIVIEVKRTRTAENFRVIKLLVWYSFKIVRDHFSRND